MNPPQVSCVFLKSIGFQYTRAQAFSVFLHFVVCYISIWIRKIRNYQFPRHSHTEILMTAGEMIIGISSVQLLSHVQLCEPMDCGTPGILVHHQLPELAETHVHWVSDAIQPYHPLSSPFPHAFNLSQHQGLFQWVSSLHQVTNVLEAFSISPSDEYLQLISFRIDWFDLLAFQEIIDISILKHSLTVRSKV